MAKFNEFINQLVTRKEEMQEERKYKSDFLFWQDYWVSTTAVTKYMWPPKDKCIIYKENMSRKRWSHKKPKEDKPSLLKQDSWDYSISKEQQKYEDSWKKKAIELGTWPALFTYKHIK